MLISTMAFALTGCGKATSTTDWVNQKEIQAMVKTMSDSQSDMSIALVAVDDKTVSFQFTFADQLDIPDEDTKAMIVEAFDQQIAAQESVFTEMRDQLVKDTKIDDVVLRIEYLNADGSEIYSKDFTN
ncbi:MAG: DUF4854 domain-containing protein [Clostridiales bacterium]|nr:DUF4854 domain-containing protein [Clostridiales bacterium]